MKNKNIYISLILFVAIIITVNLIVNELYLRFDFTENKTYTLSEATENIVQNLEEPVTVTAYFSEDLPPHVEKAKKEFKEMLIEYANLSNGMLVYKFVNPSENEEKEQEAVKNGVQAILLNIREKDQVKQQKVYLGAILNLGENKEIIPFVQAGSPMEYALSTAIKKISVSDKPKIALIQGHGEAGNSELQQVYSELNILYNVVPYIINDTTEINNSFKAVAIIRPQDTIPENHLAKFDNYLANGGKMFVAVNKVKGDFSRATGNIFNTGISNWLRTKGINIKDNFVIDSKCGSVSVQQRQSGFSFTTQMEFPYLPVIQKFANHSVTKGLESVILQFASEIEYTGDSSSHFQAVAFSSEMSGTEEAPVLFDIQKNWKQEDFTRKNIPVAGILKGKILGNKNAKLIIISDGDFALNQNNQRTNPDNVNFLVNGIDWLSDDTGLIELRTKGISSRPIEQLEDSTKTFLKYLNFLLPILLVIFYGIIRMQIRKNKKFRLMQEDWS